VETEEKGGRTTVCFPHSHHQLPPFLPVVDNNTSTVRNRRRNKEAEGTEIERRSNTK
jgi:hypothetical protein